MTLAFPTAPAFVTTDGSAALGAAAVVRVDEDESRLHVGSLWNYFVLWYNEKVGVRKVVDGWFAGSSGWRGKWG